MEKVNKISRIISPLKKAYCKIIRSAVDPDLAFYQSQAKTIMALDFKSLTDKKLQRRFSYLRGTAGKSGTWSIWTIPEYPERSPGLSISSRDRILKSVKHFGIIQIWSRNNDA
jgi:hypothetical protein